MFKYLYNNCGAIKMIKTNENTITFGGTLGKDLEVKGGQNNNKPFGVVSVAQTTSWPKPDGSGFNERTTWMNIKLNDYLLQKAERNGGLLKGDEIVVKGYLVQRKIGTEGNIITEIQVESIISHLPKAVKELAKQAGLNYSGQQQSDYQPAYNNAPQQPAYNNAPQQPAYNNTQQQPAHNHAPQQPAHNHAQQQPAYNNTQQQPAYNNTQQKPAYNNTQQKPVYNNAPQNNAPHDNYKEDFYGSRQQ